MAIELEPGAYVTPSVRLVRQLAVGGMGTVWLAEHLVLNTQVAVKIMAKRFDGVAGAVARFAREAAVASSVKSPHVVQVFDSGVTDLGVAFIVMELLEGHDLGVELSRGPLSAQTVSVLLTQLAKALAKAHRVGVVHRDIKPDNVFLCDVEGGEPFLKLLDFGTAKDEALATKATTVGELLGTPYYMSPEQIVGEKVDSRSDIWSLGVLAFEALTGKRPFEGATVGAITLAIHTTTPLLTLVAPGVPAELNDWFARACARDPAARFQTARGAADAFARAVFGYAPPDSMVTGSAPMFDLTPNAALPLEVSSKDTTQTPSGMVATSLSATLTSAQTGRRTVMWIASAVGLATVATMVALLTHADPSPAVVPLQELKATASPEPQLAPSGELPKARELASTASKSPFVSVSGASLSVPLLNAPLAVSSAPRAAPKAVFSTRVPPPAVVAPQASHTTPSPAKAVASVPMAPSPAPSASVASPLVAPLDLRDLLSPAAPSE